MPELDQLFLIDAAGRDAAELRDTLLRHRVFGVDVSTDRDDLIAELERLELRVDVLASPAAFKEAVWAVRGSRAFVVTGSAALEETRRAAASRGLPVVEL